jgi:hypothetical protein
VWPYSHVGFQENSNKERKKERERERKGYYSNGLSLQASGGVSPTPPTGSRPQINQVMSSHGTMASCSQSMTTTIFTVHSKDYEMNTLQGSNRQNDSENPSRNPHQSSA